MSYIGSQKDFLELPLTHVRRVALIGPFARVSTDVARSDIDLLLDLEEYTPDVVLS